MYAALLLACFSVILDSTAPVLSVHSPDDSLPGADSSMDGHLLNESLTTNEATCCSPWNRTKPHGSARKVSLNNTTGISSHFHRRQISAIASLVSRINQMSVPGEMRCLALYLAAHKYFGVDTRKGTELMWKYTWKGFYTHFPKPRLKELHPNVSRACTVDLIKCVRELAETCRSSYTMKDTGLGGSFPCKDPSQPCLYGKYYPFDSVEELFSWRTSASYFMCWHTLQQNSLFKYFMDGKNCLEGLDKVQEVFGQDRRIFDFRTDNEPFKCALIAFCPDPCYGRLTKGSVVNAGFMAHDPGNQCRGLKDTRCRWDFNKNSNFEDLQRNRFNVSCQCAKERAGFEWNSQYELCVDIDECSVEEKLCEKDKICQNQVGSYTCLCKRGYRLDVNTGKCYEHYRLPRPKTRLQKNTKATAAKEPESFYEAQLSFILGISGSSLQRVSMTTIHLCLVTVAVFAK